MLDFQQELRFTNLAPADQVRFLDFLKTLVQLAKMTKAQVTSLLVYHQEPLLQYFQQLVPLEMMYLELVPMELNPPPQLAPSHQK